MRGLMSDTIDGLRALSPRLFPYRRFALALVVGVVGAWIFLTLRLPLPWMLGPMLLCTIGALVRAPIAAPPVIRPPMTVVIGVMMGSGFRPELIGQLGAWLPTLAGLALFMAVAGLACILYFRRAAGYDPTTAFFAGMPGGLVEMVTAGEERGGDGRIIALIHSTRILLVVMTLPFLMQWLEGVSLYASRSSGTSLLDTPLRAQLVLIACGLAGVVAGRALRLPAAFLLGPMLVSAAAHLAGWSHETPPAEVLSAAQLVLGVTIGARFVGTPPSAILRILLLSLGSTVILLACTLGFAFGIAAISAYGHVPLMLAYSPGGLAEMSLIAVALHTEVAFVAAHHIVRIFLVMVLAAPLFGLFIRRRSAPQAKPAE